MIIFLVFLYIQMVEYQIVSIVLSFNYIFVMLFLRSNNGLQSLYDLFNILVRKICDTFMYAIMYELYNNC